MRIAVVGAGVIGLSSAVNVQKVLPSASVTIIADKFWKDTTSFGAGGFFRPDLEQIMGETPELPLEVVKQWIRDSWHFYSSLANSPEAADSGQTIVPGTVVSDTPKEENYLPLTNDALYDFHRVSEDYLKKRNLGRYKYGYCFTTVVTNTPVYLRWLMRRFREAGGMVENKTVADLRELSGDFDIVVNCCGLGGQKLVNDKKLVPVKGQLVMVKAPWIKEFFFSYDNIYFIPHNDKLNIGGARLKGNYSLDVDKKVSDSIFSRAQELFPQLKGAQVISEWAGLRPSRHPLRLEAETLDCGSKGQLKVVHHYGHGGHGITLSWGTAVHAAKLVKQVAGVGSRL